MISSLFMKTQHAFLHEKNIANCALIANESIDAMLKAGWPGIICKVDMEKVYDHVN